MWVRTIVVFVLVAVGVLAEETRAADVPDPASRLQKAMLSAIAEGKFVGCVGLISVGGQIRYYQALGLQNRERGKPMLRESIFQIGSLTKMLTSAGAAILVERGLLDLDAPIAKYLPEFENIQVLVNRDSSWIEVPPRQPPSVRHIFAHTAGLATGWYRQDWVDDLYHTNRIYEESTTSAELVEKLARIPLKYHPGEVWEYSIAGDVLGRLVEVVSRKPLDEFLAEEILLPLGMTDTRFWLDANARSRLATLYILEKDGRVKLHEDDPTGESFAVKPTYISGGSGLVSTAHDFHTFLRMLMNGGVLDDVRVMKESTAAMIMADQIGDITISPRTPWIPMSGFGLGVALWDAPGGVGKSIGWNGSYGTWAWMNPELDLIGVFMIHLQAVEHGPSNIFHELAHDFVDVQD